MILFGKKKEVPPTIYTEETCSVCGEKMRRPFEEGDYVFRNGSTCKKCGSSSTMVSAVYGEYPPDKDSS
ncbi:hypothetical protein NTE_02289 [Candidatus Nitrososphaera evergladensis SR1]|uniref:Uncharacterized protein n=3 Tax=Nitrososphaera TaxID=497726 RepID=A0A060HN59_9ARCH|nr:MULTISPECIES: hypothetical protein [Nitrososphaera]AIC14996.1 hypothetical protein NVIE_007820 [Nitrososphaera viennensis EN76]AIF84342.1 hypothetical protein NTE_02289 [Candidatus Nitrososphaera evergladensis SR1]UVS69931.1 hypothetical protein NWT39_03875 [Nitrososphaera viennensis]